MTTTSDNALDTLQEICAYLGRSEKTVRKLVRREGLPARRVGGRWLSDKAEIDRWRRERVGQSSTCL